MPVIAGSMTQSIATAVTAASAAVPPARRVSTAASVASGCEVAAMPLWAMTAERPGRLKSRLIEIAVDADALRGDRRYGWERSVGCEAWTSLSGETLGRKCVGSAGRGGGSAAARAGAT